MRRLNPASVVKFFLFLSCLTALVASQWVGAHSNNGDFWGNHWYWASANYDSTGEAMSVRYRDAGDPDYHCPYVKVRASRNHRTTESPKNCSTRTLARINQGLLVRQGGGLVALPGQWRVCRSGHWTCRAWRTPS